MKRIAVAAASGVMALTGSAFMAAPAQAAPVVTGGVVNVTVTDVIDDVTVTVQDVNVGLGVAAGIAANVCNLDLNIGGILGQFREARKAGNEYTCESDAGDQVVTVLQQ